MNTIYRVELLGGAREIGNFMQIYYTTAFQSRKPIINIQNIIDDL